MKLSPKTLVPVLAAFATIAFASPAFAWNSPICNPQTGAVLQGGGAEPLTTETLYNAYLSEHPGSFEMGPEAGMQDANQHADPNCFPDTEPHGFPNTEPHGFPNTEPHGFSDTEPHRH